MTIAIAPTTIYALASAAGKSGVSVFRISGPQAREALVALGVKRPLVPRMATLVKLYTPVTCHLSPITLIDTALALYFPAPYSFTGEDVVELHTHGSRAVSKLLLAALESICGLRMAQPGEFARRAFMNGKLDLAQIEGLADLIDAETSAQHRQAMRQMGGITTQRVEALRSAVLQPLALMEAYIDFPEEEIPEAVLAEANLHVETLRKELTELLADGGIGEKIREGLEIVILGAPNAGKSSLLNALAQRDAAIVSDEAGTTRDLIVVPMEIAGYAVTLVDTAGIRETPGAIEAEGIRRALARAEHADLTLQLVEVTSIAQQSQMLKNFDPRTHLIIATKADLAPLPELPFEVVPISTISGQGLDALKTALHARIAEQMAVVTSPVITRARHREAMREALSNLKRVQIHSPLELICEDLRLAAQAIGKITGKIWVDDVLDLVFSRFCIGK